MIGGQDLDTVILDVWREHLAEEVMPNSSLFDLGGSSLTAAGIAAELGDRLEIPVRVSTVLCCATPAALAVTLRGGGEPSPSGVRILTGIDEDEVVPASAQQESIWFLEQMYPGNFGYNTIIQIQLDGPLDVERLRAAMAATLSRHEILRTGFRTVRGRLSLIPESAVAVPLTIGDRVGVDAAALDDEVRSLGQASFDLDRPPLLHWHLLAVGPREWRLVQVEHHFIHDGWSSWLLLTDLADGYRNGSTLPPEPTGYRAFAHAQQAWLGSAEADAARDWWRSRLSECGNGDVSLPGNNSRPPVFTFTGSTVFVDLTDDQAKLVADLAVKLQATEFSVLLAVFAGLVGRFGSSSDLVLGTMVRNRTDQALAETIGMFVGTIGVPIPEIGRHSIESSVAHISSFLQESEPYTELPFSEVVASMNVGNDPSRNPLFNCSFSFNDWPQPDLDFGEDLSAQVDFPSNGGAKFDLDVVVAKRTDGGYRLLWRYYDGILDDQSTSALIEAYGRLLHGCADRPAASFAELWTGVWSE